MDIRDNEKRKLAAEDRAVLRAELAAEQDADGRLAVFDALATQAEDADEEVPPMPDALRDKLVERFGGTEAEPKAAPRPVAPLTPGVFARLSEFFQQKQVAYGGLAIAACALLLFAVLPRGGGDVTGAGKIDPLRGGGTETPALDEVPIYLFPEAMAAPVVAMMNPDRPAVVCRDAADLEGRLAASDPGAAIAADLERRVVTTYRAGEATVSTPVGGGSAADVLLEIRAALDAVTGSAR